MPKFLHLNISRWPYYEHSLKGLQGEKKPHSHTHTRARAHTGGQTSGRHILPGVAGTASIVSSSVLAAANGILSSGARLRIGTLLIHRQGQGSNSSVFSIHRTERKESSTHATPGMRQLTAMRLASQYRSDFFCTHDLLVVPWMPLVSVDQVFFFHTDQCQ